MNLNRLFRFVSRYFYSVSIPIRDLMNLNRFRAIATSHYLLNVSIPIRDLMNLNLSPRLAYFLAILFQSLLGI